MHNDTMPDIFQHRHTVRSNEIDAQGHVNSVEAGKATPAF
jgi:hypothetical protein